MQRLQFNIAFPPDIQIPVEILWKLDGPNRGIYEWELAQLAKELIINAPVIGSTDFRTWSTFSDAVNRFKRLDNDISGHYEELFRRNILVEMHDAKAVRAGYLSIIDESGEDSCTLANASSRRNSQSRPGARSSRVVHNIRILKRYFSLRASGFQAGLARFDGRHPERYPVGMSALAIDRKSVV